MSIDLFDPFDEDINEETETASNVAACASLTGEHSNLWKSHCFRGTDA
jgi:hypothetical protein